MGNTSQAVEIVDLPLGRCSQNVLLLRKGIIVPFDARSVANMILDLATAEGRDVSNLVLQKLVYFAHGRYLSERGEPLVHGEFEAWQYGPVHPHVYNAFKEQGKAPIKCRAETVNPVTGERRPIPKIEDPIATQVIIDVFRSLKSRSPTNLVAVSHAKNAPWKFVVDRAARKESISMRIPNEVIRERFRFHAVISSNAEQAIPDENSPFD
jgi:uncharacterized phage-associated protein